MTGLAAVGARKLQEGVHLAFDKQSYHVALRISVKAVKAIPFLLSQEDHAFSAQEELLVRCSLIFYDECLR